MTDWSQLLAAAPLVALSGVLHRMVESQAMIATQGLVGSLSEQMVLEEMLEKSKPPKKTTRPQLHFLLFTPFRYPPLKHGSRFGRRTEQSLFYGSMDVTTALYEVAYYRFMFLHGMSVFPDKPIVTKHTLFGASFNTTRGMQLENPPFRDHRKELTHPSDYSASQSLGSAMRETGIEAFTFLSARSSKGGVNVALFNDHALDKNEPVYQAEWLSELHSDAVLFADVQNGELVSFDLKEFLVEGKFPVPE